MEMIKLIYHSIYEWVLLYPMVFAMGMGVLVIAWVLGLLAGKQGLCRSKKSAFVIALLGGVVAFFAVPTLINSSVSEINYYMDWIFQIIMIAVLVVYLFLVAWPLLSIRY